MLAERVFELLEVWRLQVPFQNVITTETNVYVVRDGGDVLIVDMGAPSEEAAAYFVQALEELGVDIAAARYFFTHLHMDHAGLADMLLPPETALYINEHSMRAADARFSDWISRYTSYRFQEEGVSQEQATAISDAISISTPINIRERNATITSEGDLIRVGRYGFRVIGLPGHTRGMQGLYNEETGICFSGDQLLFILSPAIGLFLDYVDSMMSYRESMEKLLSLDITTLFHSHGDIRPDFRERGEKILQHHERRVSEVVDIVAAASARGELPTGAEVTRSIRWKIPFDSIERCELMQQWLIFAQGVMLLDHAVNTERIVRIPEPAHAGEATLLHRYSIR